MITFLNKLRRYIEKGDEIKGPKVPKLEPYHLNKEWMKMKNIHIVITYLVYFALYNTTGEKKDIVTIRWRIYEKYTTWELHGEVVDHFSGDNTSERNEDEVGHDENEVNMLEYAYSVVDMME